MVTKIRVCDYCVESVEEDAMGLDFDSVEVEEIAQTMGYMLPDHLCDSTESNGEIKCSCLCKR